ncbi:DUF222 domain-containing protein [Tsukamurella sp. PLM1]|uniref:DUF222 domain-containing protein n=1 Tax=Tsukamurella sp. PLM1 TaxID=2929795 RepID=UPI00206515D6|nr:hypothetical protein MTP03_41530 [Tsukamurella sp. PLM1]
MSYSDDAFTLGRRVATPLPGVFDGAVSGLSAGGALSRLREPAAQQNRLEAERAAVLTRLYELRDDARRVREESSRRFVDDWDELVAEVGAALGVGRTAAGSAVHRGLDLRERCPRLFELFAAGKVSLPLVREVLRHPLRCSMSRSRRPSMSGSPRGSQPAVGSRCRCGR